jgi:putative chitinase
MIDRTLFFAELRKGDWWATSLVQSAVDTINEIFNEWERRQLTELRWLAYMIATARGEVGMKLLPVREGFKDTDAEAREYVRGRRYKYAAEVNGHVYYGRGLVQLTWHDNYKKMTKILGVDLVNKPDLALDPRIAIKIMFEGMLKAESTIGDFTGKSLEQYFNATTDDPEGARAIINGTDRKDEFAAWHRKLHRALKIAEKPGVAVPQPERKPPQKPGAGTGAALGTAGAAAGAGAAAAFGLDWASIGLIGVMGTAIAVSIFFIVRKVRE